MTQLTSAAGKLALLVFLVRPLQAADQVTRFSSQPGSKVTIKGGNNFHDWEIQGQVIGGLVELGADFPIMSGQTAKLGKMQSRIEGNIPVRSLHSSEGKQMDEHWYNLLKEEANPRICFHFSELTFKALPKSKDDPYLFNSRCELVVAGVTNQVSMPVSMIPFDGKKIKLAGGTAMKMSDFGIRPPELHASSSIILLETRDEINLAFECLVGQQP